MASLNEILAQLNGNVEVAAASPFTNAVLAEAFAQRQKARSEKLVSVAIEVTETIEKTVDGCVKNLREIRKCEKNVKDKLDKVNRAAKYFAATGNPLPFYNAAYSENGERRRCLSAAKTYCESVGATLPEENDPLWSIPAEWVAE